MIAEFRNKRDVFKTSVVKNLARHFEHCSLGPSLLLAGARHRLEPVDLQLVMLHQAALHLGTVVVDTVF